MENDQSPTTQAATTGRRLRRQAANAVQQGAKTLEKTMTSGLRQVRTRARRHDLVGEAAFRALSLVHDGAGAAAKSLVRLEEATQPPARTARRPATTQAKGGRRSDSSSPTA